MAGEALNIKVGADLAAATAAFKKLETDIQSAFAGGEDAFKKFVAQYQQTSAKVQGATQKTGRDFTGLSRVLQDLPFGFIAIQNNLQQLVPAAGAAGLAFAGITAALSFAQIGLQNWVRGNKGGASAVEEHKKQLREAKEALEDYVDGLGDIDKVRLKGAQNAQEELTKLQLLYKASQDANVPLAERRKLVDELQDQYPKYFKNISDEIILAGGAQKAYERLSNAILQSARARAAEEEIVSIQKQVLAIEQQQIDANQELFNTYKNLNAAKKAAESTGAFRPTGAASVDTRAVNLQTQLAAGQDKYNNAVQKGQDLQKQRLSLLDRMKNLEGEVIDNVIQNGADVLIDPGATVKKVKEEIEKTIKLNPPKLRFDVTPLPTRNFDTKVDPTGGTAYKEIILLLERARELEAERIDRARALGETISGFVTPAFTGMFDAILEGKNVLQSFFSGLASGLKSLLGKMAQALAQALALRAVFALIPGLGSFAGFSNSSSIGDMFKKIMGFADGGIPPVGKLSLVGERGPELFVPNTRGTIIPNHMLGGLGGGAVEVFGRFELEGDTLVAAIAKTGRSQGRRY